MIESITINGVIYRVLEELESVSDEISYNLQYKLENNEICPDWETVFVSRHLKIILDSLKEKIKNSIYPKIVDLSEIKQYQENYCEKNP